MTIQWHLTTGPTVDVLQLSGFLGDDAVNRFNGAVGWAIARGERTLLLDCTQLEGWSPAGRGAVTDAAGDLGRRQRALELVAPPEAVAELPVHPGLPEALHHHQAAAGEQDSDDWQTSRWDGDPAN